MTASAAQRAVLVIDRPPPLSPNTTMAMGWRKRSVHTKLWQEEAATAWANAGRPWFERPDVHITLYSRGDRMIQDDDNAAFAASKPIMDGLKGRAFTDDSRKHIGSIGVSVRVDNKHPRVEIELKERRLM